MQKKKTLLLGAHISITGGIEKAVERGESIGCTAIQIFTKSNRQWGAKPLSQDQIDLYKKAKSSSIIKVVVVHASYLINIGSPDKLLAQKSIRALEDELSRCEKLNIPYLVLHPGSRGDDGEEECLKRIARNLDTALDTIPGKTMILLENMAGQGSSVCNQLEELATIYEMVNHKKRVGICIDLCHAYAAGYDLASPQGYKEFWEAFDKKLGLSLLHVIHLNDSKKKRGSRVDRHEDIGKGEIGAEGFRLLLNDKRFFEIPKILETPKESLEDDLRNMRSAVDLISEENKKILDIKVI